ncbi:phage integrase N-terminal domain-containing protein [Legionella pneumophila]|uniref:phage integrase N-terminal domain-containing protein n=1 Tax=Legionella pneumophila TaxID=446 RepID=UPI001374BF59|nr:phage integrase N-terminal domain-containing protein [Legionella pneumophila]HAT2147265.1 integrase [Legionella pneumophila]HAT2150369.1 integrase [Legionella pneumophila]HAT8729802.1 integrase [Legionella pneumophila]HCC0305313.1 integrase [Legionella pneumophila]
MTINSLRQQAVLLMKTNKDGTYKERQRRAFVLEKMLNALYALKHTPASWQDLDAQHIHSVVKRWKDKRIKPSTIMRYMTIIRKVLVDLGCQVHYIDNKSLLLSRPKPRKKRIKISSALWQSLINPAVRLIMALQIHFGLTFQEAIHFKTSEHVKHGYLWIAERIIPICTEEQQAILHELEQLITEKQSLIKKYGQQYIRISWHSALKRHKLPSNRSWRYWYAKQRLVSLLPEVGYTEACLTIRQEMGIKSRNTLNLYLKK